jgi:hypothetical protein
MPSAWSARRTFSARTLTPLPAASGVAPTAEKLSVTTARSGGTLREAVAEARTSAVAGDRASAADWPCSSAAGAKANPSDRIRIM